MALTSKSQEELASLEVAESKSDSSEDARNQIIKDCEHRVGQSVTVYAISGRSETSYQMNDGPFEGRDPGTAATEADGVAQLTSGRA